jgi:adenylate cyclase
MGTTSRARSHFLIVFLDLTRFAAQGHRSDDEELASTLDEYYERVARAVSRAGGRTVKFIGDAALLVFPETQADAGVDMLLALKEEIDDFFASRSWECRMNAKVHFGDVVAGDFGPPGDKRFDVVGRAVNTAAVLASQGVTLSADAFRTLGPALRRRFRKHTPPVTYIRLDDPRPRTRGASR